jgi:hypothetical protein
MSHVMVAFLIGLLGAVVGAISTNYFWRQQRYADLCLDVLRRLQQTAAEIQREILSADDACEVSIDLEDKWLAAATEIEDLLPGGACDKLNQLTYSITNETWDPGQDDFSNMRQNAFRQLYATLGLPPCPWKVKQKVKFYFRTSASWLRSLLFKA